MNNVFYTHRKYLIEELEKLKNNKSVHILEFGVGDGSSLIMNDYASKYPNFKIESYETDEEWFKEMKSIYSLPNYKFNYINEWDNLLKPENFNDHYDLIFIDQAPWEARTATLELLKHKSNVIILHDYDFFNKGFYDSDIYNYGKEGVFSKYLDIFNIVGHHELLPPTLVMNLK